MLMRTTCETAYQYGTLKEEYETSPEFTFIGYFASEEDLYEKFESHGVDGEHVKELSRCNISEVHEILPDVHGTGLVVVEFRGELDVYVTHD